MLLILHELLLRKKILPPRYNVSKYTFMFNNLKIYLEGVFRILDVKKNMGLKLVEINESHE